MPTLLINDAALCADDLPWSSDEAQVAAVAFFARYSGRTLEAYRHDLRYYFQWATDQHLAVLDASRAHIEIYRSTMEQRGLAASQPRRSIGDARRCAATTASPTSTAVSRPTRPSTSGGPRSNRPNSTRRAPCAARPQRPARVRIMRDEHREPRVRARSPDTADRRQRQQARSDPARSARRPHDRPRHRRRPRRPDPSTTRRPTT
jgi:hypothetical protein